MCFNIYTGNHNSHHGIGDTVLFLKNALQDCGHYASISHRMGEIANGAYERFKTALPMTRLLPSLLEESIEVITSAGPQAFASAP